MRLAEPLASAVRDVLDDWRASSKLRRLWHADASLWTGSDEGRWLGWLHAVAGARRELTHYRALADEARSNQVRHVLLLGMGGSSLCCEVLARTFGSTPYRPELRVVDTTVPSEVRAAQEGVDPAHALCIVSSKSGSTLETDVLSRHFFETFRRDPKRFIAITDPGSDLERRAREQGWRAVLAGVPEIGGRFSALSAFGMAPGALIGVNIEDLLARAQRMVDACAPDVAPERSPGVVLGAALGALAREGRDKLTLVLSPRIASLGAWLEQLVAESTGKHERGIVPVDGERLAPPDRYGPDRLFAYVRLADDPSPEQDARVEALEKAGHPVLRIEVAEAAEIGAELFRWEMATAVAGSVLGVNPFDQPDVEEAKAAARRLAALFEERGTLQGMEPLARDGDLELHTTLANARPLERSSFAAMLRSFLARIRPRDYFAVNAFVARTAEHDRPLQALRHAVRDARGVATAVGYGPRFLHSTGQLHKGGPNNGVFLQITANEEVDVPIPGRRLTFGALKDAQAAGDFEVLCARGRRILRIHVSYGEVGEELERLAGIVASELA